MAPKRTQGMTILEVLMAFLIFILVILGFMKGISDFMLYLKASKINSRAKELAEKLRSEILNSNYTDLQNCFNSTLKGTLNFNSSEAFLTIDNSTFYTTNCPFASRTCMVFYCLYCYTGEELSYTTNASCGVGYPIGVGYNSARITYIDNETGEEKEIGLAIGLKVYFTEPKTKRQKEINLLVFKKKGEDE